MHSLSDWIVISQNNKAYVMFNLFDKILCVLSTYTYSYIAAFRLHNRMLIEIYNTQYFFESVFLISMISNFFVEFTVSSSGTPCRDLKLIALNYLKNDFKMDFIALLPLQMIPMKNKR